MSEYRFFLLHKILVLLINVLVLVALTIAMYVASLNPEEFTLEFIKVFGGILLPILVHPAHPPNVYRSYEPCRCALERAESRS